MLNHATQRVNMWPLENNRFPSPGGDLGNGESGKTISRCSRWWRRSSRGRAAKPNTRRQQPTTTPASATWGSWRRNSNAPSTNPGLPLLSSLTLRKCACVWEGRPTYVIWCKPDVSWHGCVVLGCIPCVRVKECSCSRTAVIPFSGFPSMWLHEFILLSSPSRPYFELKAKYYLQLEVCTVQ